jgi:hypothetical protein
MLLGRELIQNGDIPRKFGRFLNDMETYRCRINYGSGGVERDTDDLIQQTIHSLILWGRWHCLDKDEQVEELVIDATLKPAQREFRHGYA